MQINFVPDSKSYNQIRHIHTSIDWSQLCSNRFARLEIIEMIRITNETKKLYIWFELGSVAGALDPIPALSDVANAFEKLAG